MPLPLWIQGRRRVVPGFQRAEPSGPLSALRMGRVLGSGVGRELCSHHALGLALCLGSPEPSENSHSSRGSGPPASKLSPLLLVSVHLQPRNLPGLEGRKDFSGS